MRPVTVVVAVVFSVIPALGQEEEAGRGVARISLINGDVTVRRGDSGDWVAAAVNAPLVVEDRIATGPNSRTEVQFDSANFVRIDSSAELRLSGLENRRYQLQLANGTITFRVLRDSDAEVEIDTPTVSVRPAQKGTYRITVREDGETEVTVRNGEVEVFTPRGVERLRSGRTLQARGTASDPEYQIASALEKDDWDRWNERRDSDLLRSSGYRYAHRDIYGIEDLDPHGRWVQVPDYGHVWSPRVTVGWAPYRLGRWVWVDWYGWTWVSHEPWGWAPYHYGRWFYHRPVGWCWYPGGRFARHRWSPALVAFVGFGGFRTGLGFGRVGWIPLAPRERYHPWYGRGIYSGYRNRNYIDRSVNITNNVNIRNVYRNARIGDAVTVVDNSDFGRGRGGRAARLSEDGFRNASLVRGQLPITPGRENLRMADREVRRGIIPANSGERSFSSRRAPARVERVSFEDQRRSIERLSRAEGPGRGTSPVQSDARVNRAGENGRGWRSAGDAGTREGGRSESVRRETGSWRRFGEPVTGANSVRTPREAGRVIRPEANNRDRGGSWRRFGDPGADRAQRPGQSERIGRESRSRERNQERFSDRVPRDSGRSVNRGGGERTQPLRINPPMVRERSSPRIRSGGGGGFGGRVSRSESGGGRPAAQSGGGGGGPRGGGGSRGGRGGGGRDR
ncbi:MAG: DUF6600 domain-containing protein [Bryobacteraceae bacterium]